VRNVRFYVSIWTNTFSCCHSSSLHFEESISTCHKWGPHSSWCCHHQSCSSIFSFMSCCFSKSGPNNCDPNKVQVIQQLTPDKCVFPLLPCRFHHVCVFNWKPLVIYALSQSIISYLMKVKLHDFTLISNYLYSLNLFIFTFQIE